MLIRHQTALTERVRIWSRAKGSSRPFTPMAMSTPTLAYADAELERASSVVRSTLEFQVHVTTVYAVEETER